MTLHEQLETALRAALPLTEASVLKIAADVLPTEEREEFNRWFEKNGAQLVKNLNA